ncbi:MAG: sigma-70 family RNA polymerase sigma factor [Planctomycetes bacterium]|nr:sigma-70 family RNA polymerase sigma factor [Planctomycetota bacterium]
MTEESRHNPSWLNDWLREVLEQFEGPLLRYAGRITGDADRARDVVQETFLSLVRSDLALQGNQLKERLLQEWLFKVCRNRAIDVRRKEKRVKPLMDEAVDLAASPSLQPAQILEAEETASQVVKAMKKLPPQQQEVLYLKFQNGLSYREIGQVMNLTVSNVGFLIHTALKKVRDQLKLGTGAAPGSRA